MTLPELTYRVENGWLTAVGGFLCDGCAVREPFEHRCHRGDGVYTCSCEECRNEPRMEGDGD